MDLHDILDILQEFYDVNGDAVLVLRADGSGFIDYSDNASHGFSHPFCVFDNLDELFAWIEDN